MNDELIKSLVALKEELEKNEAPVYARDGLLPSAEIPDGECHALERITLAYVIIHGNSVEERIEALGKVYLTLLPKGTEFSYTKINDGDLSIPFEFKFTNRLFKQIKTVQLQHVRHVEEIDGRLEQYNVVTGMNYFDKDGKKLFDYAGPL
jgi:hypothetical protein